MSNQTTAKPNRTDKALSLAITALTIAVFAYGFFLAWEKGDVILMVMAAICLLVAPVAAIRWGL